MVIHPTSQMEHFTEPEFQARFDELTEKVIDQDIGIVIEYNGHEYILCPGAWFVEFKNWGDK